MLNKTGQFGKSIDTLINEIENWQTFTFVVNWGWWKWKGNTKEIIIFATNVVMTGHLHVEEWLPVYTLSEARTIKLLEENVGGNLCDLERGNNS